MTNNNPYKEEIVERIKELIREGKPRDYIMDKIKEEFKGLVFPTTPYEWWKDIIKDQDIKEWEKENKKKVISLYDHKRNAKIEMYYWTFNRYKKQLKKFEDKESEDPDLLKDIYNLQDRLQTNCRSNEAFKLQRCYEDSTVEPISCSRPQTYPTCCKMATRELQNGTKMEP